MLVLALLSAVLVGLAVGLAVRGCLVLGDRRELDLLARRLIAEQQISDSTRSTLAAMRQVARERFRR